MNWQDELFTEKSLWSIFWKSRGITGSRANTGIVIAVAVTLSAVQVLWWYLQHGKPSVIPVLTAVRAWAETGVSFSAGILGFLLAGFSIFATMTRNELFVALAHLPHKKGNISRLKFVFFNFIIVFIYYLAFLATCLAIHLFLSENTPFTKLIGVVTRDDPAMVYGIVSLAFVVVGSGFVAMILLLKSFIWNLYQSVLLAIATEEELRKRDRADNS